MTIPIICFVVAGILLILLITLVARDRSKRQEKNEDNVVEQQPEQSSSSAEEIVIEATEASHSDEKEVILEPIAETVHEVVVDEHPELLEEPEQEKEAPLKIEDTSYREALKKFQAKKPELVKDKKQISDSDYRNALRTMKQKGE